MIKKITKIPVESHLYCDDCGTEMEFTGIVLTSNPAQYPHKCPKCSAERIMSAQYPCLTFENDI